MHGHIQVIEQLLKEHADINVQNKEGVTVTVLTIDSRNSYTQIIELYYSKEHTDVNYQNKNGWTALMKAHENSDTHIVELLLKGHANINIWTIDGWTALIIARPSGHKLLLYNFSKGVCKSGTMDCME